MTSIQLKVTMKALDVIILMPKAIWSYLKAAYNAISENLSHPDEDKANSFDEIYNRVTVCKKCPARNNETCMACGCNCFVKCELEGECPIWRADIYTEVFPPLKTRYPEYHGIRVKVGETERWIFCTDDKIYKYPYIVYQIKGDVNKLFLKYFTKETKTSI